MRVVIVVRSRSVCLSVLNLKFAHPPEFSQNFLSARVWCTRVLKGNTLCETETVVIFQVVIAQWLARQLVTQTVVVWGSNPGKGGIIY